MITYFPDAYPDELFYSVIARFFIHSGKQDLNELYRHNINNSMFDMDSSAPISAELAELISRKEPLEDYFLSHTMIPYYGRFKGKAKAETVCRAIYSDSKGCVSHNKSPVGYKRSLKYCPLCVSNDRKIYGETYWHRIHQIPEAEICPVHQCRLLIADIPFKYKNVCGLFTAEEYSCNNEVLYIKNELEISFTNYLTGSLTIPLTDTSKEEVSNHLHYLLFKNGYYTAYPPKRKLGLLLNDINKRYSSMREKIIHSTKVLNDTLFVKNSYPFTILLLFHYFGVSISELNKNLSDPGFVPINDLVLKMFCSGKTFKEISECLEIPYEYIFDLCSYFTAQGLSEPIMFEKAAFL